MKKAIFLDRDGVINVDTGYVFESSAFEFIDGVFEACRRFSALGYELVVVTNQSGIARGYYSEEDVIALSDWMVAVFAENDVCIAGVYYSPFLADARVERYRKDSECRKPGPGMLLRAAKELGLDLSQSVMVGDKFTDLEAAQAAGLPLAALIGDTKDQGSPAQPLTLSWQAWPSLLAFSLAFSE